MSENTGDSLDDILHEAVDEVIFPDGEISEDLVAKWAATVDPRACAREIIGWLCDNVENYIDSTKKTYRIQMVVESKEKMPQTYLLQRLFQGMPQATEDQPDLMETEIRCLDILHGTVSKVKASAEKETAELERLFKRIIYYYEMIGFSNKSGAVLQAFDGTVVVDELIYDTSEMTVTVKKGLMVVDENGQEIGEKGAKETIKEVTVPEGFSIDFTLQTWAKQQPSLY